MQSKGEINNNGYDYVDLGLPSGTLWATCNVGANKPSDAGLYFQWGDTKGYKAEQVGIDKRFNGEDYKFSRNGSERYFSKYKISDASLELEDDAAHIYMGGDWHMPTPTQFLELIDNTISVCTKQDDINGRLFTSKKHKSASLFFPVNGYAWDGLVCDSDNNGDIWTSTKSSKYVCCGKNFCFSSEGAYLYDSGRVYGFPVRGVIG